MAKVDRPIVERASTRVFLRPMRSPKEQAWKDEYRGGCIYIEVEEFDGGADEASEEDLPRAVELKRCACHVVAAWILFERSETMSWQKRPGLCQTSLSSCQSAI